MPALLALRSRLSRRVLLAGLGLSVLGLLCSSRGSAESAPEFLVVVHPSNPLESAERQFVADAFLKRTTRFPGGEAIRPVDLRADSRVRKAFSKRILNRSVAAVRSYWQQRIFSGRGVPPPELDSDEVVLRYVQHHPGAIGYVSFGTSLEKAKVLVVK